LSVPEVDALLAPLRGVAGLLLAVSGGPDSVAMLGVVAAWRARGQAPFVAVATFDHRLRPDSRAEAQAVGDLCARLGLPHAVLAWESEPPRACLQEAAREARYLALGHEARRARASHLLTAHTLDDQAETILMRLSRGSGPSGLAGMRTSTGREGVILTRPFLGVRKSRLVATCRAHGWPFAQDLSNADSRFTRARWRALMPALAAEGLTPERLALLAARTTRAEAALEGLARGIVERARRAGDGGSPAAFDARALLEQPAEIALRALALILREAGGGDGPFRHPRLNRLEALAEALQVAHADGRALTRTQGGHVVTLARDGRLLVAPEGERRRGRRPIGPPSSAPD